MLPISYCSVFDSNAKKRIVFKSCYESIFGAFLDTPEAIFSIHSFCHSLAQYGISPGTFITVKQGAYVIRDLIRKHYNIPVSIIENNSIALQKISSNFEDGKPLVGLLPVEFGFHILDQKAFPLLFSGLCLPGSIGSIIGVKDKAFYAIGRNGKDQVVYFDPHSTQSGATLPSDTYQFFQSNYHLIDCSKINSSLMLCFYWENVEGIKVDLLNLKPLANSFLFFDETNYEDQQINLNHFDDFDIVNITSDTLNSSS